MTEINTTDYLEDSNGNLVLKTKIKEIDMMRHDLVCDLTARAKAQSELLKKFKTDVFNDIAAFIELSNAQYGVKIGGSKGNATLLSFDGKYKVIRSFAESITFDQRLIAAKALIDECIRQWATGVNENIVTLVNYAFETDKEGKVSATKILGLKRLPIADEKWQDAMKAISESINVTSSKGYIRFYERREDGSYKAIPLDVAADF